MVRYKRKSSFHLVLAECDVQALFKSEASPVSDVDGLFRIRAWIHYASTNPLNDDQLLLANDVAALLEQSNEAREVIELLACGVKISEICAASETITERILVTPATQKARAFLEKYWGKEW